MGGDLRRTPLYEQHVKGGGKLVGFAGWEMPIQYPTGQLREHEIVRSDAGLFDVSHMGRFWFEGPGAIAFVNGLITNDFGRAAPGQLLYSALCHDQGGMIDDVTVYRYDAACLMVVNASNLSKCWDWISGRKPADVSMRNLSDELAQLALQGPRAQERFAALVEGDLDPMGYYRHGRYKVLGTPDVIVSRNGYTGEDGFEIYLPAAKAGPLWEALIDRGVQPIGLGARDTLRMEMCYALYGNELDMETTPLEAGIGWTVKLKKEQFVGRDVLLRQKEQGLRKSIVGFEVAGPRAARHGQTILHNGAAVGVVTSGGPCPSLGNRGMGLGFVRPDLTAVGTPLSIDVRGTMVDAVVIERPFYKNASHR